MTEQLIAAGSYDRECVRCPWLAQFLVATRAHHPHYWARPVPSFGAAQPRILIVGLAPGMHGANRTGRPFTGDHAGILLYQTLHEFGLASQPQGNSADDGLQLRDARIANAVKCLPPANKPLPQEIRCCNAWLAREISALAQVRVYLALGRVAHDAVLMAKGLKASGYPFRHAREHPLPGDTVLLDSYHCSRYNTSTRRLTPPMFRDVVGRACVLARLARV
ncbi:MAG: uracil-DNA glycosylase [Steroidobacteraceae bacterium]